jgi:hypothetical protein
MFHVEHSSGRESLFHVKHFLEPEKSIQVKGHSGSKSANRGEWLADVASEPTAYRAATEN